MELFDFLVNVVLDGALCLFGYVGNILTIIVLQKDGIRTSNSVFLQSLAVTDSCYLTYALLYLVLRSVYPNTGALKDIHDISDHLVAWVMPFAWTALTASIWTVMVIAVDRYIVVKFPFRASHWCTPKRARVTSVMVVLAAVLFNLVRWPRYYFVSFRSSTYTNTTYLSHLSEDIPGWNKDLYRNVYHITLTYIFIFIIPLTIITVVNILLIRELHLSNSARWKMSSFQSTLKTGQEKNKHNITLMLVIVITVFLICQLADFLGAVVSSGYFYVDPTISKYYTGLKECLLVFGSAYNFYVYCIFYKRFRSTLVNMFKCGRKQKQPDLRIKSQSCSEVYVITECTRM